MDDKHRKCYLLEHEWLVFELRDWGLIRSFNPASKTSELYAAHYCDEPEQYGFACWNIDQQEVCFYCKTQVPDELVGLMKMYYAGKEVA